MFNPPPPEILARLPRLYATEDILCPEKVIHLHFFIGACDWYVAEFDGEDVFFGFANLGDPMNAEWGYFKLSDLAGTEVMAPVVNAQTQELMGFLPVFVEWDEYWTPRPFSQIKI